jgi:hypothetical protein
VTYDAARSLRNDLDALLKLADQPAPTPVPAPVPTPTVTKKLINAGWFGNTIPTPSFIRANWTFLQSQPFDGQAVYLRDGAAMSLTQDIMKPVAVPIDTIRRVLAPMIGLPGYHFALVQGSSPPDFFDPAWGIVVENWRRLAQVCREVGLTGIIFDNEQYHKAWGNYDTATAGGRTLAQYQVMAKTRGAEVMSAVSAASTALAVITLHGPSISRTDAPAPLFPQWQSSNELLGPFFEGMLQGAADKSKVVDGGELYHLRSAAEFAAAHNWRRINWPGASLAYGVYDRMFSGVPMDATILRTTLERALKQADEFCWMYSESVTFLLPADRGGASAAWVEAVRMSR